MALAALLLTAAPLRCQEKADNAPQETEAAVSYGFESAFYTKYVSRGLVINDKPVFQQEAWVSWREWTLSVWGNMDMTDFGERLGYGNERGHFTEFDFTLSYSKTLGTFTVGGGYIYYRFPRTGAPPTQEVFVEVGADVPLSPKLTVYYDFDEGDGIYAMLSASREYRLSERIALNLCASVAYASSNYNRFNLGRDVSSLSDATFTVSLPIKLSDKLTLTPSIMYSNVLNGSIAKQTPADSAWVAGLALSASF